MERDELKRFISDHRDQFEVEKAPRNTWNAIESELHKPNPLKKYGLFSLLIIGIVGIFLGGMYLGQQQKSSSKQEVTPTMYANVQPQFQQNLPKEVVELENYYKTIIEDKKSSIQMVSNTPLTEELQILDSNYEELKSEFISKNADEDLLIHLMIENYKLRIKLLEMTLRKSQKNKHINSKDNKYERNEY